MSKQKWVLIAPDSDSEEIRSGGTPELGFAFKRLSGGMRAGVELLEVKCGRLQFSIIPTRGMGIWKAVWEGVEFGWQSPIAGPVHPSFVPLYDPSGLGWLDGFDELLARCGLHSNGPPEFDAAGRLKHPLHGRIANTPAQHLEIQIDEQTKILEIRGTVLESRFHFQKLELTTVYRCQLGRPVISIHDDVTNRSGGPATFQLLYHFNFGPPVLDEGAKFVAPVREVAPRDIIAANGIDHWDSVAVARANVPEQVFFMKLLEDSQHRTAAMLHNSKKDVGAVLTYDNRHLPCFSLWKNATHMRDGYVVGLEPATNYPNVRSFEESRERVVKLEAEASYKIHVELAFCCGQKAVANEVDRIRALQKSDPHCFQWPSPTYSPPVESGEAKA